MPENKKDIYQVSLRAARANVKLTQKEAAKALNVSNKTLGNWENGISMPDADKIDSICELYNIPYDNIIFLRNDSLKAN